MAYLSKSAFIEVKIGLPGKIKDLWVLTLNKKPVTLMHGVKFSLHVNFSYDNTPLNKQSLLNLQRDNQNRFLFKQ